MGLNASLDEWCRGSDEALHGCEGVLKLVDDILVFAPDLNVLQKRIVNVLTKCKDRGMLLFPGKKFGIGNSG